MKAVQHFVKRNTALESERSSFINYWRELSDFHLAHRGRFLLEDFNKGHKRNTKQINNTSRLAVRTLQGGMMAGITSPARPWFRLSTPDTDLMEYGPVKEWIDQVEKAMRAVFNRSNLYQSLIALYGEMGVFGTPSMGIFRDYENVIRCAPYTVGSFCIAANGKGLVDTHYRKYRLSAGALVTEFGKENVSTTVRNMWDSGNVDAWVPVYHAIEPNDDRDMMSPLAKNKPFRSVYFEEGNHQDKFLRESGFDEYPIINPRWEVTGEDVYATSCPGMDALGDTKALQLEERKRAIGIDKQVDPPLIAPMSLRNRVPSGGYHPGDIEFVDNVGPNSGMRSMYDVNVNLEHLRADIQENEYRIKRAFYEDLFLMLATARDVERTAREIAERHEEKLLMLGPMLLRLHNEGLDPIIDRTFNIMQDAGMLPPPPPELTDQNLQVEYISILAQAQKMTAISGIEATLGFVTAAVQIDPDAALKFNGEQAVDMYADAMGTPVNIIRSDDEVEKLKMARQQQERATMALQMAQQGSEVAKNLSSSGEAITDALGI